MKQTILLFLLAFCQQNLLFSQEFVVNGGFETPNECSEFHRKCSPVGWYSTSTGESSYDYVPNMYSRKRGRNVSAIVVADESKKKYIQAWLSCPVEAGKRYRLSFFFRKTDKYDYIPFGLYFSNQFEAIDQTRETQKVAHVSIESTAISPSIKPKRWYKSSLEFIAPLTADFMTMGNFVPYYPQRNKPVPQWHLNYETVKYYLDDVSLQPVEKGETCQDFADKIIEITNHHARHLHNQNPQLRELPEAKILEANYLADEKPKEVKKETVQKDTFTKVNISEKKQPEKIILPNIFFAFDRYELLEKHQAELLSSLEPLRKKQFSSLDIIGYTDNKGSDSYNQTLSLKRAETIQQFLFTHGFCSKEKIAIFGKGAEEPVADNNSESGRQLNRRVEIFIKY
jgi:outer membrane protein OmpA-like peptidoglycan-associated protein